MKKSVGYKDINLSWINQIPKSWDLVKPWTIFSPQKRKPLPSDDVITCFRDGEVTLRKNRREDGFTVSLKEHGYQRVLRGDLVVHEMDGFEGSIGVSDSDGKSTPVYTVIEQTKNHNNRYWMYMLRYLSKTGFIESLSKSIRERTTEFRWNMWKGLKFPLPPINEQKQIVDYLDKKINLIDELLKKIEQKIDLLKEHKTSLINEVVTKGLNPNVEMKDSDIGWIGEIPSHWELYRLNNLGRFSKGKGITKDKIKENGNKCIRCGEIYTTYELRFNRTKSFIDDDTSDESVLGPKGVLLFTGDGESLEEIGKCVVYEGEEELYIGGGINVFTPKQEKVIPIYLSYVVNSESVIYQKSRQGRG